MSEVNPTPRQVIAVVRRERSTLLRLECGHDRSIGGHVFNSAGKVGDAALMAAIPYPCFDGHCGKAA